MPESSAHFTSEELRQWRFGLAQADDNNVFAIAAVAIANGSALVIKLSASAAAPASRPFPAGSFLTVEL